MRRTHRPSTAMALAMVALTIALMGSGFAFGRSARHHQSTRVERAVTWHRLTLKNGWQYGDFDTYRAAWYKDAGGIVHLRGSIANGTDSTVAFRLPVAARPGATMFLQAFGANGTAAGLRVEPNGIVIPFDDTGGTDVEVYTGLDGISFKVP